MNRPHTKSPVKIPEIMINNKLPSKRTKLEGVRNLAAEQSQ